MADDSRNRKVGAPEPQAPAPTDPPADEATDAPAKIDHDKAIDDAILAEKAVKPEVDRASYGVFADHPQKFVVEAEMVGKHRRGEEISYRELMCWRGGDRSRPDVAATKANADRLVAGGHIRPLVGLGG